MIATSQSNLGALQCDIYFPSSRRAFYQATILILRLRGLLGLILRCPKSVESLGFYLQSRVLHGLAYGAFRVRSYLSYFFPESRGKGGLGERNLGHRRYGARIAHSSVRRSVSSTMLQTLQFGHHQPFRVSNAHDRSCPGIQSIASIPLFFGRISRILFRSFHELGGVFA
jgi:hypothetical protein